jgi:hypothetical protein
MPGMQLLLSGDDYSIRKLSHFFGKGEVTRGTAQRDIYRRGVKSLEEEAGKEQERKIKHKCPDQLCDGTFQTEAAYICHCILLMTSKLVFFLGIHILKCQLRKEFSMLGQLCSDSKPPKNSYKHYLSNRP